MSNREYDYLFKLVIIGNSGVGKSSLLLRYTDDSFSENYISTIGVDFKFKTFEIDNKGVKLQIWDTAGQERFRTITNAYYKGADAIIIVYDTTCMSSFEEIEKSWMDEIYKNSEKNVTIMLIGNKCDLESQKKVDYEKGQLYAKEKQMLYYELSAKTSLGVSEAFEALTKLLIIKRDIQIQEKKQKRKQQRDKDIKKKQTDENITKDNEPKENVNLWLKQNSQNTNQIKKQECNC